METTRALHPAAYTVLFIPFGTFSGFLSVATAFLATRAGFPLSATAGLIALNIAPNVMKPLWAPLLDTTLSRRRWYLLGNTASALGLFTLGATPIRQDTFGLLVMVILLGSIAQTIVGMSADGIMAHATSEAEKGRAGGWSQAGILGGLGVGGGAGLWLAQHLPTPWMASAIVALVTLACGLALLAVPATPRMSASGGPAATLRKVGIDLWSVLWSRRGIVALVLCLVPIGSGAASNLWAAVANDWRASANTVALVTGVLGGLVTAAGCLAGGWLADRMRPPRAYATNCALLGAVAGLMAAAPRTPTMYTAFTLLYALVYGMAFASFTGFVLEAIGTGAAATKYTFFAALGNAPIFVMTRMEGWAHDRWGASGMLYTEAIVTAAGVVVAVAVMAYVHRHPALAGRG